MNVLIACEESQQVCKAFRARGHNAYSCDITPCTGGHDEWHIQGDALCALNAGLVTTANGQTHYVDKWDLLIAHPPCTYLSGVTTRHLSLRVTPPQKVVDRMWKLAESAVFFMQFALSSVDKVCVENPLGFMSRLWRKPDQIIHPYYFADSKNDMENYEKKRTCFWLKGLNPLQRTTELPPPLPYGYTKSGKALNFEEMNKSSKVRSKTFPGIAKAMAEQWGAQP